MNFEDSKIRSIYIFSDWSFAGWSAGKRKRILEHMTALLAAGHFLYTWENEQLVKMTPMSLHKAFNDEDFDDLLAAKVKPATRNTIIQQAQQQQIDLISIQFLDFKACTKLAAETETMITYPNKVAPLFAKKIDEYHLNQTKQNIVEIEIANASGDEKEQTELHEIKAGFAVQKNLSLNTYKSGVDSKVLVRQNQYREPIFKSVALMTLTPSCKYYRNEVYTDLVINDNPSSPLLYFELLGMNSTEQLIDCKYSFQQFGLTQDIINQRKAESTQTLFRGTNKLSLTSDWQALPSIHPDETLLDISIQGLKNTDFHIKYSKETRLYFIQLIQPKAEPKEVSVNLLLRMPKHYQQNPVVNTLTWNHKPQEIHRLLMKYLKLGKDDGRLRDSIGVNVHNGHEYLNEVRKLGSASCRLRAIAFKEEMNILYPDIPVFIIVNSDHCFIEMELDGLRDRYCLGGYRNAPGLVETFKENTLEFLGFTSKKHRFFNEFLKSPQSPDPQLSHQNLINKT